MSYSQCKSSPTCTGTVRMSGRACAHKRGPPSSALRPHKYRSHSQDKHTHHAIRCLQPDQPPHTHNLHPTVPQALELFLWLPVDGKVHRQARCSTVKVREVLDCIEVLQVLDPSSSLCNAHIKSTKAIDWCRFRARPPPGSLTGLAQHSPRLCSCVHAYRRAGGGRGSACTRRGG